VRVVLLGEMTGTRDGQQWPPRGSIVDLPDEEAVTMIRGSMARPADPEETVEVAVADVAGVESRPLTTESGPGRRVRAGK